MVFVHAFAGVSAASLLVKNRNLTQKQKSIAYLLGAIGGIFPDLDISLMLINVISEHRDFIAHSVVPYTLALIMWYILTRKNPVLILYGLVFYLGVCTHLILDMATGGLTLLAPFTSSRFGLPLSFNFSSHLEWAKAYFSSGYLIGELGIILLYFYLLKDERNKIAVFVPWIFFVISVLMVLLLAI